MNKFFSGSAFVLSLLAFGLSALAAYKVSTLPESTSTPASVSISEPPTLTSTTDAPATPVSTAAPSASEDTPATPVNTAAPSESKDAPVSPDNTTSSSESKDEPSSTPAVASQTLAPIQEGQFVLPAYDNQVMIELVALKRQFNSEGLPVNIAVLEFRMKRDLEDLTATPYVSLWKTKARHPENREEYNYVLQKVTDSFPLKKLPVGAWADAYVWLKIPQDVNQVDVVMPEGNPIFRNVPVEG